MNNRIASLVIDAADADKLAEFWADALGWRIVRRGGYGTTIAADGAAPAIDFRTVPPAPKLSKNRLHLDITPVHRSQEGEYARLLALGAVHIDVGQGKRSWYVLTDPEGNEFCLCSPEIRANDPAP